MAQKPRRQPSSYSPPWEPEISTNYNVSLIYDRCTIYEIKKTSIFSAQYCYLLRTSVPNSFRMYFKWVYQLVDTLFSVRMGLYLVDSLSHNRLWAVSRWWLRRFEGRSSVLRRWACRQTL
jgi:hypothetical protein